MSPDDTEGAPTNNVEYLNDRRPKEVGQVAHEAAMDHLRILYDLLEQENNGVEIDWSDTQAMAPFDGCQICVVREVLYAGMEPVLHHYGITP